MIERPPFPTPTRAAGLQRLADFLPRAGLAYARDRNRDAPGHPHVSGLSPWVRHRLLTEEEVLDRVAAQHGDAAEKFISEVLWRTYWKGFLELRPGLWAGYQRDVASGLNRIATEAGLRRRWEAACAGQTGIDGFDHWAGELVETGYLHNHARMWFASIWVFTLELPWALGADFFLRHLIDGDPASNTLSWRWVAGLHTPGKTYQATAENIAKNTAGRFRPSDLAREVRPVAGQANPPPGSLPALEEFEPGLPTFLLLHEDDLAPGFLIDAGVVPVASAFLMAPAARSPLIVSDRIAGFVRGGMADCADRFAGQLGRTRLEPFDDTEVKKLASLIENSGARQVVTPYAPVGPIASQLRHLEQLFAGRGIRIIRVMRAHDRDLWPLATHGFFRFREAIGGLRLEKT